MVIACSDSSGTADSMVYLNNGDRDFDDQPDIKYTAHEAREVETGDINNDGYDDFILNEIDGNKIYYGGPDGPSTVEDLELPYYSTQSFAVEDLDGDGYTDIILADRRSGTSSIYMGT
ncbi:MAG: VCBS repeat-containing protein, partial [Candidatus Brocadiae bacterium]|nr:VCBS repeat-containing protein [Candidatus Brocadiia bacterium]